MSEKVYPHANTVVCIEDSKMLKQFQYDILYGASSFETALDELNKVNYFRTYQSATKNNYNAMLDGLMKATFDLMKSIAPTPLVYRIFALYYDIHNLKLVVKERFFGKRLEHLALMYGSYSWPTIRSAAVRESDNILNNEELTRGFFEALRSKDIYDIDFIMDRAYFKTLRMFAEELQSPAVLEFVTDRIDLFNASALIQSMATGTSDWYFEKAFSDQGSEPFSAWMEYFSPDDLEKMSGFSLWRKFQAVWGATGSRRQIFLEFDVLADNYLIGKTKACKLMAFGIEPICAYFYNKFIEIKNIRILLKGKENEYDTGEIKKRMRIPYAI